MSNKNKGGIKVQDELGNIFGSYTRACNRYGMSRSWFSEKMARDREVNWRGHRFTLCDPSTPVEPTPVPVDVRPMLSPEEEGEFRAFQEQRDITRLPFTTYDFSRPEGSKLGSRYAITLFSDAHMEETVKPESVLGLNEYNLEIAKQRIGNYFFHLGECLNEDGVEELFFASLGDTITGFLRDENIQENGLSPLEAILEAQSLIWSGIKHLMKSTSLKTIHFIGITGNHGRTTKKIQYSNNYKMSYEWLMYKNLESQCGAAGLPIDFRIPDGELSVVNLPDGRKAIFCHGYQVRSTGNSAVCGIYPSLNRLALKWNTTFHQDKIYMGHFHSFTCLQNVAVNGSIISTTAYSLNNGYPHEEPMQYYELCDTELGELLTRKIYCK